jgi:hypothetical protein
MLKVAIVWRTPPLLSSTLKGWRMSLMPTLLIGNWRESSLLLDVCNRGLLA